MKTTWTPAQSAAIETDAPEVLVLAGPGSGKTATVVARIRRLYANGTDPRQFAALTFTNAAAGELARRVAAPILTEPKADEIALGFCGTLHSFALRVLKTYGSAIGYGERVAVISPESALDLLESKARTLGVKLSTKALLELKAKGRPIRGARFDPAETVVASYFDELRENGIVDYDTLLSGLLRLLVSDDPAAMSAALKIRDEFDHLIVDEVQDSAPIDWAIFRALPIRNKFLVGDSDQAVYGFRGGDVRCAVAFGKMTSTTLIRLEENFRSREAVCAAAQRLIERNAGRIAKRTISTLGPGGEVVVSPPFVNEGEEIATVARAIKKICGPQSDGSPIPTVAILARTNSIAQGFREPLAACGIPVVGIEKRPLPFDWRYARAFVELLSDPDNDALAFFYLVALYEKKGANPKEARAAAHAARAAALQAGRSLNSAAIHVGRVAQPEIALRALAGSSASSESVALAAERLRELPPNAAMLDFAVSLAELRESSKEAEGEGVRVLTMHGAKGREFDVVFVVGFEDEAIPGRAKTPEEIEEERRLAYVAITRARSTVYVSHALSRATVYPNGFRQITPRKASRFTSEIAP